MRPASAAAGLRRSVPLLALIVLSGSGCAPGAGEPASTAGPDQPRIASPLDQVEALLACIQDRGLAVTLDTTLRNQPGIEYDNRVVDAAEYERTSEACKAELTEQGVWPPAPVVDRAFLEGFYTDLVETKTCLEDEGYAISEPPSLDAFVESEGRTWHPYGDLPPLGPEELDRLLGVCPQP